MRPLRRIMAILEKREQQEIHHSQEEDKEQQQEGDNLELPPIGPITFDDIMVALNTTRPSAHLQVARYTQFDIDYGSQAL
jgi:hypothetical protein